MPRAIRTALEVDPPEQRDEEAQTRTHLVDVDIARDEENRLVVLHDELLAWKKRRKEEEWSGGNERARVSGVLRLA